MLHYYYEVVSFHASPEIIRLANTVRPSRRAAYTLAPALLRRSIDLGRLPVSVGSLPATASYVFSSVLLKYLMNVTLAGLPPWRVVDFHQNTSCHGSGMLHRAEISNRKRKHPHRYYFQSGLCEASEIPREQFSKRKAKTVQSFPRMEI